MASSRLPPAWLALPFALLLNGCGLQQPGNDSTAATANPASVAPRPIPAETLFQLLVAETAVNRNQLDIALANYYQQAYKTRDAGVTRRATLLAQHLNANQAALDLALLWSDIEPQNPEPVYIAGQYFIGFQRLDLAMQQSRRLLDMDAQPLFLAIASSPAAASQPYADTLPGEYEALLKQHPASTDLLLGYSILLESRKDYEGSLAAIQRAIDVDNKDLQARLFEVDLLYKTGRPDKAIRRMAQVVAEDPDNARLRLEYARLLADQDLEKAREQFEFLARKNSLEPDLLLARALVNYRLKDFDQAKEYFEQLLFLKKHTDSAQYYLGEIRVAKEQPAKALEHFRRVEDGPEYLPANARAFELAMQLDRRMDGQQWLAEQRDRHPEHAVRLYLIEADTLLKHDEAQRGLAAMNEAVSKYPQQPELYYARSLMREKAGDNAGAEADLRTVLSIQPDSVDAMNALGYVLANSGKNLDEAYRLVSRALALRPDDAAIMDSMGWVLYRMGRHEEALLRLRKAFADYPNDEVAAHLGEVLWAVGHQREAEQVWQKGLSLKPDSELIRSTRARLASPQ